MAFTTAANDREQPEVEAGFLLKIHASEVKKKRSAISSGAFNRNVQTHYRALIKLLADKQTIVTSFQLFSLQNLVFISRSYTFWF